MLVFLADWNSTVSMAFILNRPSAPLTRKPLIAGVMFNDFMMNKNTENSPPKDPDDHFIWIWNELYKHWGKEKKKDGTTIMPWETYDSILNYIWLDIIAPRHYHRLKAKLSVSKDLLEKQLLERAIKECEGNLT